MCVKKGKKLKLKVIVRSIMDNKVELCTLESGYNFIKHPDLKENYKFAENIVLDKSLFMNDLLKEKCVCNLYIDITGYLFDLEPLNEIIVFVGKSYSKMYGGVKSNGEYISSYVYEIKLNV